MKYLFCLLLIFSGPWLAYAVPQPEPSTSIVIDQKEMRQIIDDYLVEQSTLLPHVHFRLTSISLPKPYKIPAGRITHQVIPAKPGVLGSRHLTLLTRVDNQVVSNQSIRIRLEALADIAVFTGTFRRGDILDNEDVELRCADITRLKEPIFSLNDIVGKRLKRTVRLGEAVQKKQIEFPPVIKRGERVVIQVRGHGLMLTAAGEAKQDGRSGESIRVINSQSHREVLCRVVASGLVTVEF
jgi:flagella basal body P-ring formation protein FlgA